MDLSFTKYLLFLIHVILILVSERVDTDPFCFFHIICTCRYKLYERLFLATIFFSCYFSFQVSYLFSWLLFWTVDLHTRLYNSSNNFQVNLHWLVKLTRILLHIFYGGPSLTIPAIYSADPKLIHTSGLWIPLMLFISSYHCNLRTLLHQALTSN